MFTTCLRTVPKPCKELDEALTTVKARYHNDIIIMVGDFNFLSIEWEYSEDEPGYLLPKANKSKPNDKKFIDMCEKNGLIQRLAFPNQRGTFLDSIFVSNYVDAQVGQVLATDLVDGTEHQYRRKIRPLLQSNVNSRNICWIEG